MKQMIHALGLLAMTFSTVAEESKGNSGDAKPKWGILGTDADLHRTISESDEVVMACVYHVEFLNIKADFATVELRATVARTFKGTLKPDERITIRFPIDGMPRVAVAREKRLDALRADFVGSLRFCFLQRDDDDRRRYQCEWLDVAKFTSDLSGVLEAFRQRADAK